MMSNPALLEALVLRHGPAVVTRLRRDLEGALVEVRHSFLLRDERGFLSSLLALEGIAASIGALRMVRICRSLESQREGSSAAASLDQLHWEAERVLEALRPGDNAPGEATLRRRRDRTTGRFTKRERTQPPASGPRSVLGKQGQR